MFKVGLVDYFQDPWNYIDLAHIWVGVANIFVQRFSPNILSVQNTILMVIVALVLLIKSFFFLRIFKELSALVSMLQQVFIDLIPFFCFYTILLLILGLILGVIDWGQYEYNDDREIREIRYSVGGPDKEYLLLHKIASRVFHIMRMSIGDFNFDASIYLPDYQNYLYWMLYFLSTFLTCIIFMNFIIAEVSASYQNVKDTLHVKLLQERGLLINEAEDIMRMRFSKKKII
jgi:hypothetical protein